MAPPSNEPLTTQQHGRAKSFGAPVGGNSRRKSIHLFSRASLSGLTQINTDVANLNIEGNQRKEGKKLAKRNSLFGNGPSASPDPQSATLSSVDSERSGSPKIRPRTLQKGRPSSLFGSLGKRSMHNVDEGESDNLYSATPESPYEDGTPLEPGSSNSKTVLHFGEVQTTSGMFRKKKEFLVLTETHLLRFKSQSRATETFPNSRNSSPPPQTPQHDSGSASP